MWRWGYGAAALALALVGCAPHVFHCDDDEQCENDGRSGICAEGHCAFEAEHCPSGWAYAELAPPALASTCVSVGGTSQGDAGTSSSDGAAVESSGSTGAPTGGASGSDGDCREGTACEPDDPCALTGTCDDAGACIPVGRVSCDDPPSLCHAPNGTCNPLGLCEYAFLDAGLDCDDGDACTVGDTCDGRGQCVSGEICPTNNPCEVGRCDADGCAFEALPNGTSCGMTSAKRCCGGACVDISSDTQHCGGCNTPCAEGLSCESVALTSTCEFSPPDTSGRCRCQYSNAQCPNGQICRTYTPFTDRCTPPDESNCDGIMVYMGPCPNYCTY